MQHSFQSHRTNFKSSNRTFIYFIDIGDKIRFLQESSNVKMSNIPDEHSYLLIVKTWKCLHTLVVCQLNFEQRLFPTIRSPIILHRHITKSFYKIKSDHVSSFQEFVENLLTAYFLRHHIHGLYILSSHQFHEH